MNWKFFATVVVFTPILALFGGIGALAWNISQSWDARNTDTLISGLVASCGMGGIVMAGLLAAIIGIPFAMRLMDRWRESEGYVQGPAWRQLPHQQNRLPDWMEQPPMIEAKRQGAWQSQGPGQYDLWDDEEQADTGW